MKSLIGWFVKTFTAITIIFAGIELMVYINMAISDDPSWIRFAINIIIAIVTLYWTTYMFLIDGTRLLPKDSRIKGK
jgi:hypothetical protein